jgi:hypothetical protein
MPERRHHGRRPSSRPRRVPRLRAASARAVHPSAVTTLPRTQRTVSPPSSAAGAVDRRSRRRRPSLAAVATPPQATMGQAEGTSECTRNPWCSLTPQPSPASPLRPAPRASDELPCQIRVRDPCWNLRKERGLTAMSLTQMNSVVRTVLR